MRSRVGPSDEIFPKSTNFHRLSLSDYVAESRRLKLGALRPIRETDSRIDNSCPMRNEYRAI